MMRYFLVFFLLISALSYSQESKLTILEFNSSECDKSSDIFRVQTRIISQGFDNGPYRLSIGTIANCAGIYDPSAILSGDTLKISYNEGSIEKVTDKKGMITGVVTSYSCDCCFQFNFTIMGLLKAPALVTVNDSIIKYNPEKYKVYPEKYQISGKDTINRVDKYGFRQGYWYATKGYNGYLKEFYINNDLKTGEGREYFPSGRVSLIFTQTDFDTSREERFYDNGNLKLIAVENGRSNYNSTSFFENGKVERTYITTEEFNSEHLFYDNGHIKKISGRGIYREYYPNGQLSSERLYCDTDDVWEKFYYDSGQLMAVYYIKPKKAFEEYTDENGEVVKRRNTDFQGAKRWWECFDKKGNRISKTLLVQQGYKLDD